MAARRQPPSLKGHLFQPRFETTPQNSRGNVTPCRKVPGRKPTRGQPCRCCDVLNECTSFKFFGSSDEFELRFHFTCDTMNVVYALTCSGCGHNYIGQTERAVRDRCGDYRRAVSDPKFHTQGVHKHIAQCGNGNFIMTPFFKLKSTSHGHNLILTYESHFIKRYKPSLNESKLWCDTKKSILSLHIYDLLTDGSFSGWKQMFLIALPVTIVSLFSFFANLSLLITQGSSEKWFFGQKLYAHF